MISVGARWIPWSTVVDLLQPWRRVQHRQLPPKTAAIRSRPWWSPARGLRPGTRASTSIRSFDVDEHLRVDVPFVIASWSTHGPATGLFTWCTMTGTQKDPESEVHLFRCEFSADKPSTYHSLIGGGIDYAILSLATEGELDRASRFREIFSPFGLTDELRVVLRIDGTVWGSANPAAHGRAVRAQIYSPLNGIGRSRCLGLHLSERP
jgi:hypothetical protein